MIFTIGYDGPGFTTNKLAKILDDANAILIDVRLFPKSRLAGWGTNQLKAAIGESRYIQRKDLGGGTTDKTDGIEFLQQFNGFDKPNCVLMCKEENPAECHRHYEICVANDDGTEHHFPDALHIHRDGIYRAAKLTELMNGITKDMDSIIWTDEIVWFCETVSKNPQLYLDHIAKNPNA